MGVTVSQVKDVLRDLTAALRAFLRGTRPLVQASRADELLTYLFGCFLVMFPIAAVGQFLNWAMARQSLWIALGAAAVTAVAMLLAASLMANEQFLKDAHVKGHVQWPSLFSIGLAWLAVVVFGGLSCGFERLGIAKIAPSVPFTEGCATRYADMYLWHLFDSIPGIRFTETVRWTQRYTYSDALSGWLLVSFKVLVIVSVIRSFVASGRIRREAKSARLSSTASGRDVGEPQIV